MFINVVRMMLWIRPSQIHLPLMVEKQAPSSLLVPSPISFQFLQLSAKTKMPLWSPFMTIVASTDPHVVSLPIMLVLIVVIISPSISMIFRFPFGNLKQRNRTRILLNTSTRLSSDSQTVLWNALVICPSFGFFVLPLFACV